MTRRNWNDVQFIFVIIRQFYRVQDGCIKQCVVCGITPENKRAKKYACIT